MCVFTFCIYSLCLNICVALPFGCVSEVRALWVALAPQLSALSGTVPVELLNYDKFLKKWEVCLPDTLSFSIRGCSAQVLQFFRTKSSYLLFDNKGQFNL